MPHTNNLNFSNSESKAMLASDLPSRDEKSSKTNFSNSESKAILVSDLPSRDEKSSKTNFSNSESKMMLASGLPSRDEKSSKIIVLEKRIPTFCRNPLSFCTSFFFSD